MENSVHIGLLIPTYRRPADLRRCLAAISLQSRLPNQVVLVYRSEDTASRDIALEFVAKLPVTTVMVDEPGVVHALNRGLEAMKTEITAITDDDSAPPIDWISRIAEHFLMHPDSGGFGGRDIVIRPDGSRIEGSKSEVGRVRWFGKIVGNHHLGSGSIRRVDVLKGVNCAFPTKVLVKLKFDEGLLGRGAQTHWELSLCRKITALGFQIFYDPNHIVLHHVGERFDEDLRTNYNEIAFFNNSHNELRALCSAQSPFRRIVFLAWHLLIGHSASPGIAYTLGLLLVRRDRYAARKFILASRARILAFRTASITLG